MASEGASMRAVCMHAFGGIDQLKVETVPRPLPGAGEVVVRVMAAGVGPWDAWIREGKSKLGQRLPIVLGSDFSGVVEAVGDGVTLFRPGDEVWGAPNPQLIGGYAEYTVAQANMIAKKPSRLSHVEAASAPIVAVTAWQMLFEYGGVEAGRKVLVLGGAGNVGAYAVQLAKEAGAKVLTTVRTHDVDFARQLGADEVIDTKKTRLEDRPGKVDVIIDTVGGAALEASFVSVARGGVVVSVVEKPNEAKCAEYGVRGEYFIVDVTTTRLDELTRRFESGKLSTDVGEVLPLNEARIAHEMLAGKPHKRGKIVLRIAA